MLTPHQAKTAIAPLDRVKILFQAQNPEFQKYSGRWTGVFTAAASIVSTQGPAALFQGHSATLLRIFPYAAIKYMAYDKLHFVSGTKGTANSGREGGLEGGPRWKRRERRSAAKLREHPFKA
jgi:solute carrier family 25 protein 16